MAVSINNAHACQVMEFTNSPNEAFELDYSPSSLSPGQYTLFVRAIDDDNNQGAIYSEFLNVVDESLVGSLSGSVKNAVTGEFIENALFINK